MPVFDLGLQHRVKRLVQQTADQHRHLAALWGEIDAALERGELADAPGAIKRFGVALAAHFELEQGFFFPALHGLSPGRSAELEALEVEHADFLNQLRGLEARIGDVPAQASRDALAQWFVSLREHEQREQRLVTTISDRP